MRAAVLLVLFGLATVGCDQASKQAAVEHLEGEPPVALMGGAVRLVYAENPGAFMGLGDQLPDGARAALFVGVNLVILGALGWWALRRRQDLWVQAAATLIIAGGIGNLVDRVLRDGGRVVDFLVVGAGPVRTGVFNLADVAVMVGAGLLLVRAGRRATAATPPAAQS